MAFSAEFIRASLADLYGNSINASNIRDWCVGQDVTYQTVTKKIEQFKTGRGEWNLTIAEQLEQSIQSPVKENLIPEKDDTFVEALAVSAMLKKLFHPAYSTLSSLQVSLATAKRFVSSKRVLNSDAKSSV